MFCYYTWSNIIEQTNKGRTITKIFMRKVKNPLTVPYQHSLLLKSLLRARILYHCLCSHKCLSSSHLGSTRKKGKEAGAIFQQTSLFHKGHGLPTANQSSSTRFYHFYFVSAYLTKVYLSFFSHIYTPFYLCRKLFQ